VATATKKRSTDQSGTAADDDLSELVSHLSLSILRSARVLRQVGYEGVSTTQGTALAMIDKHGPLTVGELASLERIARPTASAVVTKLEELGCLRRLDDPNDGRICRVELTPRGRSQLKAVRERRNHWLAGQLKGVTAEELEGLRTALRLLEAISEGPCTTKGEAD
jgi:DNA-binding MarR family transcriptional regulator